QERQERAEREFVTNAAHQLQSPLAAIVSAIDVLQAGAKDDPERDVFLGHIDRETHRLARLAQALLILARAQTGAEAPRDEVVPLARFLQEIAGSLRPAAGVEVHVSCPEDIALITNQQLVEQALLNVAENAAKYTTEGRISLSARAGDGGAEGGGSSPRLEPWTVGSRSWLPTRGRESPWTSNRRSSTASTGGRRTAPPASASGSPSFGPPSRRSAASWSSARPRRGGQPLCFGFPVPRA